MNDRELSDATTAAVLTAAVAIMVSGWVHFYLYFRGGYRGIAPESVLGLTIGRSFALHAIGAVILAEALVLSLRFRALLLPAAALGTGFALASVAAFVLSRTSGLLGFEESSTSSEAVVALVAEAVAVVALAPVAVRELNTRRRPAR
jgi:hypothetical protein